MSSCHRGQARLIVLPPRARSGSQPIEFDHAAELIEGAAQDARAFLADGGGDRPPIRMRTHRHGPARGKKPSRRYSRKKTCGRLDDSRHSNPRRRAARRLASARASPPPGSTSSSPTAWRVIPHTTSTPCSGFVNRGCPPELAARIVAPIDDQSAAALMTPASAIPTRTQAWSSTVRRATVSTPHVPAEAGRISTPTPRTGSSASSLTVLEREGDGRGACTSCC